MFDVTNLAKTIWGEARGEPREGREAVANTIMNRLASSRWFSGATVSAVVTRPFQFSAWNPDDPNSQLMDKANEKTPGFLDALEIAALAMAGRLPDRTFGATHYHAKNMSPFPKWALEPDAIKTTTIGNHVFYRNIA